MNLETARDEIKNLLYIRSHQHHHHQWCLKIQDCFTFGDRDIAVVTARHGQSLQYYITRLRRRGATLTIRAQKQIAGQTLEALHFLHTRGITHADIKPDNIMLTRTCTIENPEIRLIDFGLSLHTTTPIYYPVMAYQYRAPEVFLEQGYNIKADIWSMACVFVEMYTGELLFNATNSWDRYEQMRTVAGLNQRPSRRM